MLSWQYRLSIWNILPDISKQSGLGKYGLVEKMNVFNDYMRQMRNTFRRYVVFQTLRSFVTKPEEV